MIEQSGAALALPIKSDLAGIYKVFVCRSYRRLEALCSASTHRPEGSCERGLAVRLNDA